jgi:cobalamin biosynthesis Co2+ chelatase CbiK
LCEEINTKKYKEVIIQTDKINWVYHYSVGEETIEFMLNPDQVVIKKPLITLKIDYPLANAVLLPFQAPDPNVGFTRKQLAIGISKIYNDASSYSKHPRICKPRQYKWIFWDFGASLGRS